MSFLIPKILGTFGALNLQLVFFRAHSENIALDKKHFPPSMHNIFSSPKRRILFMLALIIEVKRNYWMFFAKCPPPPKSRETGKHKIRISFSPDFFDKIEYRIEWFFCAPIVGMDTCVATKFEDSWFLSRIETSFLENHHSFWFSEDVVIESAFGNSIFCGGLSEAHLLRDDSFNRLLEVVPCPGWSLQLQQVRVVS